jgi:hypothetical protein
MRQSFAVMDSAGEGRLDFSDFKVSMLVKSCVYLHTLILLMCVHAYLLSWIVLGRADLTFLTLRYACVNLCVYI